MGPQGLVVEVQAAKGGGSVREDHVLGPLGACSGRRVGGWVDGWEGGRLGGWEGGRMGVRV